MGIRQQKREKPNTYAKTGNTTKISWSRKSAKSAQVAQKKTTASVQPVSTQFLVKDLTRTGIAFVIAFVILGTIWWMQYQ